MGCGKLSRATVSHGRKHQGFTVLYRETPPRSCFVPVSQSSSFEVVQVLVREQTDAITLFFLLICVIRNFLWFHHKTCSGHFQPWRHPYKFNPSPSFSPGTCYCARQVSHPNGTFNCSTVARGEGTTEPLWLPCSPVGTSSIPGGSLGKTDAWLRLQGQGRMNQRRMQLNYGWTCFPSVVA